MPENLDSMESGEQKWLSALNPAELVTWTCLALPPLRLSPRKEELFAMSKINIQPRIRVEKNQIYVWNDEINDWLLTHEEPVESQSENAMQPNPPKPVNPYIDGNPKAGAAVGKPNTHAIPTSALVELGYAMLDGWQKYGLVNWRVPGQEVSASTYIAAMDRHKGKWVEGEEYSQDTKHIVPTGVHHLAHVMACCAILIDAWQHGALIDDRPCNAAGLKPGEAAIRYRAKTQCEAQASKSGEKP